MDAQTMYPVCPHRNVAAAYQRFLGPDSCGIERFFGDDHSLSADAVHAIASLASACNQIAARNARDASSALILAAAALKDFCAAWLQVRLRATAALPARAASAPA